MIGSARLESLHAPNTFVERFPKAFGRYVSIKLKKMNTYFGYILYSPNLNRYYVGSTENLERRIIQHNEGFSSFTSKSNDWVIKYSLKFNSRNEALKWEAFIQKKKKKKKAENILNFYLLSQVRSLFSPDAFGERFPNAFKRYVH